MPSVTRAIRAVLFTAILTFVTADRAAFAAAPAAGSDTGPCRVTGTITAQHNLKPVVGAQVEILELRRIGRTDASGRFAFESVPEGAFHLAVTAIGYAEADKVVTAKVENSACPDVAADFALDLQFHEQPVLVTAKPDPEEMLKVYQPTSTLGTEELERHAAASLGMTLESQPGITTTNLGTAPARPVIRGLGGDRVLILEDGLRVGDVSSISPDHAVAVDPSAAEEIEIVRGPANLLYGSNAIGGAINVRNGEVPSKRYDHPTGMIGLSGGSNADELWGDGDISGSAGSLAYKAGVSARDSSEYHFNGGVAGNSQYDFQNYHAGLSWVGRSGFVGASFRDYEGNWGIPVSEVGELVEEGEKGVTLEMSQKSYKVAGQITEAFGPFVGARLQAVRRDYTHTEFEDTGEAGTIFDLDTTEVRADLTHRPLGRFTGTFGIWWLGSDFKAEGDEVLVPSAKTTGYAGFVYEEVNFEKIRVLFGGRYDTQDLNPGTSDPDRSFDSFSGALGAIILPASPVSFSANFTKNFKAPSAEELYANGPHIATFAFEVGDPTLEEETSIGTDVAVHLNTKRVKGEITGFRTDFNNYIFLQPTGVIDPNISTLPIAQYEQADALFTGGEVHADIELVEHLTLEVMGDTVRAENSETNRPLPQIPPYRVGLGVNWQRDRYTVGADARYAGEQDRVASGETPTDDYTLYNFFGQLTLASGRIVHRISLRGQNLTNRLYRNHVSLVKDIVPQPGRNVQLGYAMLF